MLLLQGKVTYWVLYFTLSPDFNSLTGLLLLLEVSYAYCLGCTMGISAVGVKPYYTPYGDICNIFRASSPLKRQAANLD